MRTLISFSERAPTDVVGRIRSCAPVITIEREPMLYRASPAFALAHGGFLTRKMLEALDGRLSLRAVIDSRVQMLQPGMYTAIPGWHGDGCPRGASGQPEPERAGGLHFYGVHVASDPRGPRTVWADGLSDPMLIEPARVWASVHEGVEASEHGVVHQRHGEILKFGQLDLHRAAAARVPCWRWWARVTDGEGAPAAENKVRNQVQVYATTGGGW